MDLAQWNSPLSNHFAEVRRTRQTRAPELPVFALEHGLSEEDIEDLSAGIREHIQQAKPAREHALAWIVYATELGYLHSGDGYWQTFEANSRVDGAR
jgi:hypothetical protein